MSYKRHTGTASKEAVFIEKYGFDLTRIEAPDWMKFKARKENVVSFVNVCTAHYKSLVVISTALRQQISPLEGRIC
jgi:hypothetical protein